MLAAVAADVGAGGCCRCVQGGAGFGIVCSGQGDIHCLVEMLQRADSGPIVTGGTDSVDDIQGVMYPMVARDVGEGASRGRISVAGGAIQRGQWRCGPMAACAGRTDPADAVQICSMAEGTGNCQIGCVAMGEGTAPGSGIGWRCRWVGGIDVMAVLATVDQRTDLCPEAWVAAGFAYERKCVAPLTEGQVFLGFRTMQGWIGKGDRMRRDSRKMAI